MINTLDAALKGKLKENHYPSTGQNSSGVGGGGGGGGGHSSAPSSVIVFIVGGVTYEESTKVAEINANNANGKRKVILGGNTIHNSNTFLTELSSC